MDAGGSILTAKAPTTPHALEEGVFTALESAAQQRGLTLDELVTRAESLGHGTTQATNALIERNGARTGLITTAGFGDTILIQRLMGFTAGIPTERLGRFSLRRYPDPVVPPSLDPGGPGADRPGRGDAAPLESRRPAGRRGAARGGVEALAVSLLWSFPQSGVTRSRSGRSCASWPGIGSSSASPARSARSSASTSARRPPC